MLKQTQTGFVKVALLLGFVLVVLGFVLVRTSRVHQAVEATNKSATQTKVVATAPPAAPNECAANATGKLLLVSITDQHLWACDGTTAVKDSPVTTGTTVITNGVDDNTPTGTWHIQSRQTDRYLTGTDANGSWNDYVQYWMPFDGAVGFHDASWQTFAFGGQQYHTDGSHACVHLPTDIAAWVYDWAPVGTTVTVKA